MQPADRTVAHPRGPGARLGPRDLSRSKARALDLYGLVRLALGNLQPARYVALSRYFKTQKNSHQ